MITQCSLVITQDGPPFKKAKSIKVEEKNSHRRNNIPTKERPKPEVFVEVNEKKNEKHVKTLKVCLVLGRWQNRNTCTFKPTYSSRRSSRT